MTESEGRPDIHELTRLAQDAAAGVGMPVTPDEVAQALVVLHFGGVKETIKELGTQVKWTPREYRKAEILVNLMKHPRQRPLGVKRLNMLW